MNEHLHLFASEAGRHALVVDGSRIYDLDEATTAALSGATGQAAIAAAMADLGLRPARPYVDDVPLAPPAVRSLSLAVAQACNLACTYCYAQQGDFGGTAKLMPWTVAKAAVDQLIDGAAGQPGVTIAFLGGEPLLNRDVVRRTTAYTAERGHALGLRTQFSITTNGTLLDAADAAFFADHGFSVTVSLDGVGEAHDRLRPTKAGAGTYDRILSRLAPLLAAPGRAQVSARITVTPGNLELRRTLDHFVGLGFHSVGFSPMLAAPGGRDQLETADLDTVLHEMIDCGREFERQVGAGRRYPFSNMSTAMQQIHRGQHRPYPCGAGAGYLGVSSDGGLFACHRFVEDAAGAMGDVRRGVDQQRRVVWLSERHVHRQQPCQTCWARYLCGGGCHHEVIHRGRPACDYIRGWLHYCLQAYVHLLERRPDYFGVATDWAVTAAP